MLKIAAISVTCIILGQILKKETPELAFLLVVTVGIFILFQIGTELVSVLNAMKYLAELSQIDQNLLIPVVKTIAISITSKITSELCRGAGEGGVATFVEFSGAVLSLVVAIPMIEGVMTMMTEML